VIGCVMLEAVKRFSVDIFSLHFVSFVLSFMMTMFVTVTHLALMTSPSYSDV
jgi:hypothetical protein